jgi:hypothetical protein
VRNLDIHTSTQLCSFISPVPTSTRELPSSTARASLHVATRSYDGLFDTSGLHRLGGCCRSHQSWKRPNDTQSATSWPWKSPSNCNTHDPVTRRPHRHHLVHPQFVRAWVWSKAGFASWNRFFSHMGPRGARSGSEPWAPPSTPWPTAAPGGAGREAGRGGLCIALRPQGVSTQFPGVLVGPLPVRKCHQMSSKGHMGTCNSAGSPVGSLAHTHTHPRTPPPGHPTAGQCGRAVPVLPLLLCTRPARA